MLGLIKELGWSDKVLFPRPLTVMYHQGKFYPFDSILKALLFPGLGFGLNKIRFGLVGLFLRLTNNWKPLERVTVDAWLRKWAGKQVYELMWLPLVGCLLVVHHYTNDTAALDGGVVVGTFLGILLLGGVFISLGCCASAMTRSQVIAAMLSLVFGASVFLLGYLASQLPAQDDWQTRVLSCFDLFEQMHNFARGVVDTRPVVLLVSLTLFFLFLTLRVVESRRWK